MGSTASRVPQEEPQRPQQRPASRLSPIFELHVPYDPANPPTFIVIPPIDDPDDEPGQSGSPRRQRTAASAAGTRGPAPQPVPPPGSGWHARESDGPLTDLGLTIHRKRLRNNPTEFRWLRLARPNQRLDDPSSIVGPCDAAARLLRPFDVFVHDERGAQAADDDGDGDGDGGSSHWPAVKLWVWVPHPRAARHYHWKRVLEGYLCPGPGGLTGRYLVMTRTEPSWVTGATMARGYRRLRAQTGLEGALAAATGRDTASAS
ncbi:hypothetical protein BC834DRAFT_972761 [Gloeopeniophorella convolvens]|nr:hypothetical protein BC834DRAFT_972761 [Gloeopeniophorella convolvens]